VTPKANLSFKLPDAAAALNILSTSNPLMICEWKRSYRKEVLHEILGQDSYFCRLYPFGNHRPRFLPIVRFPAAYTMMSYVLG